MAEQSTRFNEPGSVFAQLNKSGEPETVSLKGQGPTQFSSKMDTTTGLNSETSKAEGMMDAQNSEYRATREKEMVDPNVDANNEINSNIKNPKPVNPQMAIDTEIQTENISKEPPEPSEVKTTELKTSRENSDSEQGWMERTAMRKINGYMADAGSNMEETKGEEPKDPDTSTRKSKKTGVGMVPALDRNRDKTSVPDISKRPHPTTPNISTGPGKMGPKLSVPKISVPKMKLR